MTLSAKDFEFQLTDTIRLAGCPLGEDDYFAAYGHSWTTEAIVSMARAYLSEVGDWSEANIDYALENPIVEQIYAGVTMFDDGEWALSFSAVGDSEDVIPVTLLAIQ